MSNSHTELPKLLRVPFLSRKSLIDGLAKPDTAAVPAISMPLLEPPAERAASPSLRIAYGADFLYICAEFEADHLVARDRGYQFGDGLILTVAEPTPDGTPSSRHYVLGFSYQVRPEFMWASRVLWEHDCQTWLMPLGSEIAVAGAVTAGLGRLEVAVPWSVLHPYHPWLSDGIGLNVLFVKGREDSDADSYGLLKMDGGEQSPRPWMPALFQEPRLAKGHQVAVVAPGRILQGESLEAHVAVCAGEAIEDRVSARIFTGEGDYVASHPFPVQAKAGLARFAWSVDTSSLPPGGYRVLWRSARVAVEAEQGLTVLPRDRSQDLATRVEKVGEQLPLHDAATLARAAEELADRLSALSPMRTAGAERMQLERLLEDLREAEAGRNPVARRRGVFRRAFRSEIDGTLQPFSVLIPDDYDDTPWPLCVMLHGSGVDDVHALRSTGKEIPSRFLVAAPYGRGASNFFARDRAQEDIGEAVRSMRSAYAVDPDRILVAGFSMGGYGALRTFYENHGSYRAVAVFSGAPAIPPGVPGFESEPDFTKLESCRSFAGTPVFVSHGRQDHSIPLADAERMVECLRRAGADVTFLVDDTAGHDYPCAQILDAYIRWVDKHVRA